MQTSKDWMPLADYCEKYGDTPEAVHRRVNAGEWHRGVEYACPDGKAGYVNVLATEIYRTARAGYTSLL